MANLIHAWQIKKGVKSWNEWRDKNLVIEPNLSGIKLKDRDLINSLILSQERLFLSHDRVNEKLAEVIKKMAEEKRGNHFYALIASVSNRGTQNNLAGLVERDSIFNQYNYFSKEILAEAAEINRLLEELSNQYPTNTETEKMVVAAKAIEQIEKDPTWKQRLINTAREGTLAAFQKAIDHPLGIFIVKAIESWMKIK